MNNDLTNSKCGMYGEDIGVYQVDGKLYISSDVLRLNDKEVSKEELEEIENTYIVKGVFPGKDIERSELVSRCINLGKQFIQCLVHGVDSDFIKERSHNFKCIHDIIHRIEKFELTDEDIVDLFFTCGSTLDTFVENDKLEECYKLIEIFMTDSQKEYFINNYINKK